MSFIIYSFVGGVRDSIEAIERIEFPILKYLQIQNEIFADKL